MKSPKDSAAHLNLLSPSSVNEKGAKKGRLRESPRARGRVGHRPVAILSMVDVVMEVLNEKLIFGPVFKGR